MEVNKKVEVLYKKPEIIRSPRFQLFVTKSLLLCQPPTIKQID